MYQSGRAGDEAKKRKSPAKNGRVGITVTVVPLITSGRKTLNMRPFNPYISCGYL